MNHYSHYSWLELIEGVFLVSLAVFVFSKPFEVMSGVVILFGVLAVMIGVGEVLFYIRMEQHMGFAPSVSLVSGLLCVLLGCCLMAHPEIGLTLYMILSPAWIIVLCISRLSHLGIVRVLLGNGYYFFTLIVNCLGLTLGFVMALEPDLSVITAGTLLGFDLMIMGTDHLVFAICDMKRK